MVQKENGGNRGSHPDPIPPPPTHPIVIHPPVVFRAGTTTVHLDLFHIDTTRARHEDTDYVTLAAQVNDQPPQTQTLFVGDVNDGDHQVNMQLGPFSVGQNDTLNFNFIIMNKGYDEKDA